jgi:signal transduction histidine kinase/CheY-like chemotaxis protein
MDYPFLAPGGEMARRIATHDWAATPIGAIDTWPGCLRHTISMMLPSPAPLVLLWGESGVMLYNDAYAAFAGGRDERLLGSEVREGWDEVADFNSNVMRVGLAGGTLSYRDHELTLHRSGSPEQVFMNLDYSPVRDEAGRPAGVLAVVVETTRAHWDRAALEENARKLGFLDALGRAMAPVRDADTMLGTIAAMVGEHLGISNCAYADMDSSGDGFTIRGNWHREEVPSIVGHYSLAAFGTQAVAELNAGRPLIVRDNLKELLPREAETFRAIGISATICVPLVKDGRLTALMAIHDSAPRDWTDYELEIILEVTERSWAHIERLRAEADLRGAVDALRDLNETLEQRVRERSDQLLKMEEQLRQSHKMEAVGQMTGGLAHDFNNLLTGIGGALEMIESRIGESRATELERYFAAAKGSVRRAASLTHRLLAFSRQQTLDPRPTDVNGLIDELAELVRRTLGPEIVLDIVPESGLWPASVDRNQLENAILNLCINARDAMPEGGVLAIATRNVALPDAQARAAGLAIGDYLAISVRDTGTGMSDEVVAKAFDPFFTTKPLGKGTGLGLSMVYGFVRQSGGEVRIESAPGAGTTITLLFPRASHEAAARLHQGTESEAPRPERGQVVLLVEDEPFVRMMVLDALEEAGYTVLEVGDGPAALENLATAERIDLLVTDVGLPGGMNGRQLADAARCAIPGLKVLFITGYAENAIAGAAGLESGSAVLTKPFEMETLARKVGQLLAG